jgi:hypothetical protein
MAKGKKNADHTTVLATEEILDYLDVLQDSGDTNMFGAGTYVEAAFGMSRNEASDVVGHWMTTWEARHEGE